MNIQRRTLVLCQFFFGLVLLLGCSNKKFDTYPVEGTVKFEDGKPVQFGRIEFYQPDVDVTAYASIQKDGSFVLGTETDDDGAVEGTHEVMITQVIMPGEAGLVPHDHGKHISEKYQSYESSDLRFTVRKQKNIAEFTIE